MSNVSSRIGASSKPSRLDRPRRPSAVRTAWLIPSLIAARTSGGLERLSAGPNEPSLSIVYETTSSISASTGADRAASPSELHRSAGRLAWRCDDGCTIDGAYQAERTSASTARDTSRRYRDCLLAAIRRDGCRIPPAPAQRVAAKTRR
eukprot:scaffold86716_cov63-Phaeocystis_antarctica.AAC.4